MSQTESIKPPKEAVVTLREVTKETVRTICNLKVAPYQEQFVDPNAMSIAQVYFDPAAVWMRGIYAGETPVGFVMVLDDLGNEERHLWRFMLDARFQGYGYGRQALALLIDHFKGRPEVRALLTSCLPGKGGPCPFYEKLGFVYTGEVDEGELVMRLDL
jgi:diamine N-acetyltransferase